MENCNAVFEFSRLASLSSFDTCRVVFCFGEKKQWPSKSAVKYRLLKGAWKYCIRTMWLQRFANATVSVHEGKSRYRTVTLATILCWMAVDYSIDTATKLSDHNYPLWMQGAGRCPRIGVLSQEAANKWLHSCSRRLWVSRLLVLVKI